MNEVRTVLSHSLEEADFLRLPSLIYPKTHLMQDKDEEVKQIAGTHILSSNYDFHPFVGYQNGKLVVRAALIIYPNQEQAYLGYFESLDLAGGLDWFFNILIDEAKIRGCQSLLGPIQASFWLGYRLRLNAFDEVPFTSEPTQPFYYRNLLERSGFRLKETYLSNLYRQVPLDDKREKLAKRYKHFIKKGYVIKSPKKKDWAKVTLEVFALLRQTYSHFPAYQAISEEEFKALFAHYQKILDYSMVKLAYLNDRLVGFLISLPDYGNLPYQKMSLWTILRILKRRCRSERYLILYLGVADGHLGLGTALSYPIYEEIRRRKAKAVGALIHQGTITSAYGIDLQADRHYYGLFEYQIR